MDPFPRLYAILDGPTLQRRNVALPAAAGALLEAGVQLLQIRWKDGWSAAFHEEASAVASSCRSAGATLVVNDRIDMARLLDAGAHVGQDDLPASAAREQLGPVPVLGVSTHNESQFARALSEPVDYVAIGPVFGTVSKPNPDPVVGVEELRRLAARSGRPVVAIGGITRQNAPYAWRAGAHSVAVIGDLYPDGCTAADIRRRAEEWMALSSGFRNR